MKLDFTRKKLSNGLVILFEKRKMPVVSISASIKQGFAYESEKQKGISHFTEHLMFKGSKTRSYKEIADEIEKKGGVLNAFTGEEITSYWNKLPNKKASVGLDIASDLILNPKLDEQEFQKEKQVILEEIKMYKDNPQIYVFDKMKSLLYKKPFGMSGAGTRQIISDLGRREVADFYDTQYKTNKMFLCVVGNTNLDQIEEFGKKFPKSFGKVPQVRPIKINKQIVEKRKGVDQTNFVLGFHSANLQEKKRYDYQILNTILTGGMSSRLFEEIRSKRGLAYSVRGVLDQGTNFGYQMIYVGTTKENILKCKEIILSEIKKIKNLEQKDLDEAKEQLIGLRKVGSEESVNVMESLIQEETMGDAREYYKFDERINAIKLKNVRNLSKLKGYSTMALVPN